MTHEAGQLDRDSELPKSHFGSSTHQTLEGGQLCPTKQINIVGLLELPESRFGRGLATPINLTPHFSLLKKKIVLQINAALVSLSRHLYHIINNYGKKKIQ